MADPDRAVKGTFRGHAVWTVRVKSIATAVHMGIVTVASAAPGAGGKAAPTLRLPYDLEARGSSLFIADGLRHQVLRLDLRTRRLTVFAGTGVAGSSGDQGPARKARIDEPTELVFDRAGNLYLTDFSQGRVRRISPRGIITTVARIRDAAGLAVHHDGGSLVIASIDGYVRRLDLATGRLQLVAGDGTQASGGDGGPAAQAQVNRPHDVVYDTQGNLLVAEAAGVRRIDATTGVIDTAIKLPAFKVVPGPGGTLYLINGGPRGGTVTQVDARGSVLRAIGTGRLSRHVDRVRIGKVGFLPSDVEPVSDAVLISQTEPIPAIRRLASGSVILTTFAR
jgi:SMP-30/Gluconolactonase/LRE-like region